MTIRSTRGKIAKALFAGERPKALPAELVRPAQRKLTLLDAAARPQDMGVVPADRLKRIRKPAVTNAGKCASIANGGCVSHGPTATRTTSKSPIFMIERRRRVGG